MDLWYYFFHRGLELLKPGGRLSFIVGSYWTSGTGSRKLIEHLRRSAHVEEIFDLDRLAVFEGVSGRHMILTVVKEKSGRPTTIKTARHAASQEAESLLCGRVPVEVFLKTPEQLFAAGRVDIEPPDDELLAKIARGVPLGSLGDVRQGIAENPATVTAQTNRRHQDRWRVGEGVFSLTADELDRLDLSDEELKLVRPYHQLADLGRYRLAETPSRRLIYSTVGTCPVLGRCPAIGRHLKRFRPIMEARRETRSGARRWWQLHWPREERIWEAAKIVSVQMGARPSFVPAAAPVCVPFSTNVFVPDDSTAEHLNYVAAILNSRLIWKWYRHHAKRRGAGLEINGHVLRATPIRRIDFSSAADKSTYDRLVELVDRMMHLLQLPETDRPDQEIAETDSVIDRLVFELYDLTDDVACCIHTSV